MELLFSFFMVMMAWIRDKWKGQKDFRWISRGCASKLRYDVSWLSRLTSSGASLTWTFDLTSFFVQATCPTGNHVKLSPTEISEIVNRRLLDYDMSTGGGCCGAFKLKLLEFFDKITKRKCYVSEQQLQVLLSMYYYLL